MVSDVAPWKLLTGWWRGACVLGQSQTTEMTDTMQLLGTGEQQMQGGPCQVCWEELVRKPFVDVKGHWESRSRSGLLKKNGIMEP